MARKVAFCLVESQDGKVLLIQRKYGKERGKWSLPGGFVDKGERSARAAVRELREETGLRAKPVATIHKGRTHRSKIIFARITGGRLKPQYSEVRDARFFSYDRLPQLAFGGDKIAVSKWPEMKRQHQKLKARAVNPYESCPYCGGREVRLRQYPHANPYRCQDCRRTLPAP